MLKKGDIVRVVADLLYSRNIGKLGVISHVSGNSTEAILPPVIEVIGVSLIPAGRRLYWANEIEKVDLE